MIKEIVLKFTVEVADVAAEVAKQFRPDEIELKKDKESISAILKWDKEF